MKRKTSEKVVELNKPILDAIRLIKEEHPFWGYRRVWATLRYHHNFMVNKKRIYRLMKENNLLVKDRKKLKAKRTPMRGKPQGSVPNEIWGIDMTKVKTQKGWAYLVFVIDWYTKKIVGYDVSYRSRSEEWLGALEQGLVKQCPEGVRNKNLSLVSDNGCQPTSERFMKSCHQLGIKQVFTSYNNPKGNAETERLMRTCKEELIWLKEWKDVEEVKKEVEGWVYEYNTNYLHSKIGYLPPIEYERRALQEKVA